LSLTSAVYRHWLTSQWRCWLKRQFLHSFQSPRFPNPFLFAIRPRETKSLPTDALPTSVTSPVTSRRDPSHRHGGSHRISVKFVNAPPRFSIKESLLPPIGPPVSYWFLRIATKHSRFREGAPRRSAQRCVRERRKCGTYQHL
jgi:hypothetical protein